ncbi:MAG: C-GCAxxG-C-C family protein, partial [Bacillota bacterium]|nr:C-GCAxxG-C-C family protein [Bacillota bacterium]
GGGMRCGEVCGAVTGALMVIGLKYAQTEPGDRAAKDRFGQITQAFMERYAQEKGALLCRDLLGYDIRDAEAKAKNPDRIRQVCPGAIESAVSLLEEMGF